MLLVVLAGSAAARSAPLCAGGPYVYNMDELQHAVGPDGPPCFNLPPLSFYASAEVAVSGRTFAIDAPNGTATLSLVPTAPNRSSVISVANGSNVTLSNIRVAGLAGTGGNTNLSSGVRINPGGALTLLSCEVSDHIVMGVSSHLQSDCGGGIFNDVGGSLIMSNTTVTRNSVGIDFDVGKHGYGGGAGLCNNGNAIIVGSRFTSNCAGGHWWGTGGGVENLNGILTATDTNFTDNHAADHGGAGVVNMNGTVNLTRVLISKNQASGRGYQGTFPCGGICNAPNSQQLQPNTTVIDSVISDNSGQTYASAVQANSGRMVLSRTNITGNTGTSVVTAGGTPSPSYPTEAVLEIDGCIISDNPLNGDGAALYLYPGATAVLRNTVLRAGANQRSRHVGPNCSLDEYDLPAPAPAPPPPDPEPKRYYCHGDPAWCQYAPSDYPNPMTFSECLASPACKSVEAPALSL